MEANTQSCIEKMCVVQLLRAGLGHVAPLGCLLLGQSLYYVLERETGGRGRDGAAFRSPLVRGLGWRSPFLTSFCSKAAQRFPGKGEAELGC